MKYLPLSIILLFTSFVSSTFVDPIHPTSWQYVGNPHCFPPGCTTPDTSIDKQINDTTTFWHFVSDLDEGADFSISIPTGSALNCVTVYSTGTGDKAYVLKKKDGSYNTIYSLPPNDQTKTNFGTLCGDEYRQFRLPA
jgi:hypothetical protein